MKLLFSLLPMPDKDEAKKIIQAVAAVLPTATVNINGDSLWLDLPQGADMLAAERAVEMQLSAIGVTATPIYSPEPVNLPPLHVREKRGHTVRLSTFFITIVAVMLLSAVAAFVFGVVAYSVWTEVPLGNVELEEQEDYRGKIALIDTIFSEYSLYDINGELQLDQMLKAYAAATGDKYAAYYTEEEYQALVSENSAKLVGVGVVVLQNDEAKAIEIISVIPNSPAAENGVQQGDLITHVGEGDARLSVAEDGYEIVLKAMRGTVGSEAVFTVQRGSEEITFRMTRREIALQSVEYRALAASPTVGYVRIIQFDLQTPAQFKTAMQSLIAAGCTEFVFDVRNNLGGDQKSVSAILSYFLEEGDVIVSTSNKAGDAHHYYAEAVTYTNEYAACSVAKEEIGQYRQYKKVVLTNGYTASAAELFTAVLREKNATKIVGKKTYGKGVAQTLISLAPFGYKGAIKLTFGYYSPPSGVNYDGVGILPDVEVAPTTDPNPDEASDAQLQAALSHMN